MLQGVFNVPSQVTRTFFSSAAARYTIAGLVGIAVMKLIDCAVKKYQDSNPLNEFPTAFRAPLKKIGYGSWPVGKTATFKEMDDKNLSVAITKNQGWPALFLKVIHNQSLETIELVFVGSHCICSHQAFENKFDLNSPREEKKIEVGTKGLDTILHKVIQFNHEDNKTIKKILNLLKGETIQTITGTISLAKKKFVPLPT